MPIDNEEFTLTNLGSYKQRLHEMCLKEDDLERDWLVSDTLDILYDEWFDALIAAGTFHIAFPDVTPDPFGYQVNKYMAWQDFIQKQDAGLVDINFVYDTPDDRPYAMFWLGGRQAKFGFMNFTVVQRGDVAKTIRCGQWVFDLMWNVFGYESMAGLTPESNWGAVRFALACGGKVVAEYPGACYNARRKRFEAGVVTQFLPAKEAAKEAKAWHATLKIGQVEASAAETNDNSMIFGGI